MKYQVFTGFSEHIPIYLALQITIVVIKKFVRKQHPNIVIVNNSESMVDALTDFISNSTDYHLLGTSLNCKDLLKIPELNEADLVLVDTVMLDENSQGIMLMVKDKYPDCKFIAISMYNDKVYLKDYLRNGFSGIVNKNRIAEELMIVVDRVMDGELAFPEDN